MLNTPTTRETTKEIGMNKSQNVKAVMTGAGRMSARDMLKDKISSLRSQADNLEILLETLPELTPKQDEAMWAVFCQLNR